MRFLVAVTLTALFVLWRVWRREYREPSYVDPESKEGELQRRRAGTKWIVVLALVAISSLSVALRWVDRAPSRADHDAEVLEQLRTAGADLTRPLELDFYLYFPTERNAMAARDALIADGFFAVVAHDAGVWSCRASKTMVPAPEQIQTIGEKMNSIAAKFGGDYDGWGAALPEVE